MTNGGAGESAPAMEVTPSQVEMDVAAPPPTAAPSDEALRGEDTRAMSFSPGRHEEGVTPPGTAGEERREDSGEINVAHLVDRPVTAEEVAPDQPRRRSPTPPPAPAANGTPKTTQALLQMIDRQIRGGINAALAPFRTQVSDIAAVNNAHAEELERLKAVRSEIGTVRGRVEGLDAAQRGAEEANRRLEDRIAASEAELAAREGRLNDVNAQLAEMQRVIQGFREQVTEFDQTVAGLRTSIRETRTVADEAISGVAALREFQSRTEKDNLHLQADSASARAAAQAADAKVGKLEARMGNIEESRAKFTTLEANVDILDIWRRRFRRILEGVDESPPDDRASTVTH